MTEGHGQQPSQQPSPDAPEGREVLEGRIIPSGRQQQRSFEAPQQPPQPSPYDPRQQFAAGPTAQGEPWSAASGAQGGQGSQAGQGGQGGQGGAADQGGGQPPLPQREGPATTRPGPHQASVQQAPEHPQLPQAATPQQPAQAPQGWQQDPAGQQGAAGPARGRHAGPAQGLAGQPGAPQQGFAQQNPAPQQGAAPQQGFPRQQTPAQGPGPQGYGQQSPGAGLPRQNAAQAPSAPRSTAASGGPGGPGTPPGTPDWNAMAERQEATGARRRKVMMLTGGLVAIVVIAGGVATAVVMSGKNGKDSKDIASSGGPSGTTATQSLPPAPSFSSVAPPPPANPLDYLSTAAKDTAPITPATLFPGKQFLMNGRVYVKTATTVTTKCATGARAGLSQALGKSACRKLIRATYTNGTTAVTVGVAVFDDTAHAKQLQKVAQYLAPLNGGGVKDFCHAVACRMTSNAVGRYAYFAISGLKDGKTITATDQVALTSANDASNFAFQRIIQRGRDAAAADPSRN